MTLIIKDVRRIEKYTETIGLLPSIAPTSDHTDGSWTSEDIYKGELYLNLADRILFTRDGASIINLTDKSLSSVLSVGNIANSNIQMLLNHIQYTGDDLEFIKTTVTGLTSLALKFPLLTGNWVQTFQDKNGIVALLSDITDSQSLSNVLTNGNTTNGKDINMSSASGDAIVFVSGSDSISLSATPAGGAFTQIFQTASGTIALLNDIPAPDGNGIYTGSGSLSGNTTVTMGVNILTFDGNTVNVKGLGAGYNALLSLTDSGSISKLLMFDNGETYFDNGTAFQTVKHTSGRWDFPNTVSIGQPTVTGADRVHIKGSGVTASTTSLLIQNSASAELFRIYDDKSIFIGQSLSGGNLNINGSANIGSALSVRPSSATGYVLDVYSQNFDRPYIRVSRDSATESQVEFHQGGFVSWNVNGVLRNVMSGYNSDAYHLSSRMNMKGLGTDGFIGWTDTLSNIQFNAEKNVAYTKPYLYMNAHNGGGSTGEVKINTEGVSYMTGSILGLGTINPNASALLDMVSTTQGFAPPSMTGTQVEAIVTPKTSLMVYATNAGAGDVTAAGWWGWNGANWVQLG